ncbi:hypothetical protein BKA63DRAFT_429755 [Paraphoma chrysanthemicola]|nr:hypothetical protein BKA63DRAFT_430229 [Paraphoma chrysanthemicola]KAH7061843.1 hypothetical protein BKA63DRAFT_429755 [Paraphoma chrysanthemicola]
MDLSDAESAAGSIGPSISLRIADFWLRHEHDGFTPNPRASVHDEIKRLAASKGWDYSTMMKRRKEALAAEVALHDDGRDRLDQWQQLCVEVGVADLENVPKSIRACRKALREVRINICNLLDHRRNPQTTPLHRFDSFCALSVYTRKHRIFPKDVAKRGGPLRGLLRTI